MSSLFDKLNLRPQERRLVVVVGIVVFVVLNFWLVIPMFGEYGRNEQRIKDVRTKLKTYQEEISKKNAYEKERLELESQGSFVPTEEAALRMTEEIRSQEALTGVKINSMTQMQRQGGPTGKTNAFFDEAAVTVNIVNSGEKELVDFLWRLADKATLIRAKSMTLRPDPSRMRLQGPITLVKSFQRRPPPKVAAAAAKPTPAPKTNTEVAQPAPTRPTPAPTTPSSGPKPAVAPPANPSGVPAPIPAPTPTGGTNRTRRSLPTPAKP